MKIFFVADKLEIGGTERSISTLCNYWVQNGHQVDLLVIYSGKGRNDYSLDNRINLQYLADLVGSKKKHIINSVIRFLKLRKIIIKQQPDVIISFLTHVNIVSIISSLKLKIPLIISERNFPPMKETSMFWRIFRKIFYRYASCIVVQTNKTKNWVEKNIKVKNISIIPNPCLYPLPEKTPIIDKNYFMKKNLKYVIAVGRFDDQKGFKNLLNVFIKISKIKKDWNLIIMGDGFLRSKLQETISENNLHDRVFLPGRAGNISSFYNNADIFVLSSLYEGFPNVLIEAMSYGLPVVSTNCNAGPSDIISHNINGFLISLDDFENELFNKLIKLMEDKKLRSKFSIESKKVINSYSINKIGNKWEHLFSKYC